MSPNKPPKRRLGRGLDSLVSTPVALDVPVDPGGDGDDFHELRAIPTSAISPNPNQPRQQFSDQALHALAESIRAAGLMQPIVVRPEPGGRYQLIAGERRWRAAQIIALENIPAIIRNATDRESAEFALIENLQREDLNPMDRAEAFARLANDYNMTHQEVAERVGLERSSVTNHLRLLDLDDELKDALRMRRLSTGHARALLAITNLSRRRELGLEAIAAGWSVREVERRARRIAGTERAEHPTAQSTTSPRRVHMEDLQRRLGEHLGTKVEVRPGKKRGTGQLVIQFFSFEEFDGLLTRLGFSDGFQ